MAFKVQFKTPIFQGSDNCHTLSKLLFQISFSLEGEARITGNSILA